MLELGLGCDVSITAVRHITDLTYSVVKLGSPDVALLLTVISLFDLSHRQKISINFLHFPRFRMDLFPIGMFVVMSFRYPSSPLMTFDVELASSDELLVRQLLSVLLELLDGFVMAGDGISSFEFSLIAFLSPLLSRML